jgi:hypothetical protein
MGHAVKVCALREKLAFEVVDVERPLSECGIIDQTLLEADVGVDTLYDHFPKRAAHTLNRLITILTISDDFGDHRIVVRWHLVVIEDMGVNANSRATGLVILGNLAGRG